MKDALPGGNAISFDWALLKGQELQNALDAGRWAHMRGTSRRP